ncbi:MAG: ABC transporter permease [Nitrososphaerota archaeon]|nr:ABC transporter permease [Candidatus Calditenuaceae archaeon]MDW8073327.1 ABC transporter permease [Nitrososphaerota archaeon]
MSLRLGGGFKIYWSTWTGRAGLALLIVLAIVSIYTLTVLPVAEISRQWNDPQHWADYPKSAPPTWVNLFSERRLLETISLSFTGARLSGGAKSQDLILNYQAETFPTYISLSIEGLEYTGTPPVLVLSVVRPDGYSVEAARIVVPPPRPGENPPITRYEQAPERVLISSSDDLARNLAQLYADKFDVLVSPTRVLQEGVQRYLMGVPRGGSIVPLDGVYRFTLTALQSSGETSIERGRVLIGGEAYGLMGTDVIGRDLAIGLLLGFPISLFIGVVTSVIVTGIGAALGLVSGYMGGKVDNVIQRLADFMNNIPLLPILIFLVFSFGAKLWVIILVFVAFGWPGLTIVTRSIILQLRESQFIESARAVGASSLRILARHIFPHIAPFIIAQIIFFTPSFILLEAALSFLGLGDPSLPTWGQILELGFRSAAVYLGYWWWILPPGLLIIITSITFVMISLGLEPVINPRVRGRFRA